MWNVEPIALGAKKKCVIHSISCQRECVTPALRASRKVPLVITLKSSQTDTVMYVRHVPLDILRQLERPVLDAWIPVYPPRRSDSYAESVRVFNRLKTFQLKKSFLQLLP